MLENLLKPVSILAGAFVRLKRNGRLELQRIAFVKECGTHMELVLEVSASFLRVQMHVPRCGILHL